MPMPKIKTIVENKVRSIRIDVTRAAAMKSFFSDVPDDALITVETLNGETHLVARWSLRRYPSSVTPDTVIS